MGQTVSSVTLGTQEESLAELIEEDIRQVLFCDRLRIAMILLPYHLSATGLVMVDFLNQFLSGRSETQVEKVKNEFYPVLNWENRESVKVHTLSATLMNSRFSPPPLSTPEDTSTSSPESSPTFHQRRKFVSFSTHVEQRHVEEPTTPGRLLLCKSQTAAGEDDDEYRTPPRHRDLVRMSTPRYGTDQAKTLTGPSSPAGHEYMPSPSFPSNWLSVVYQEKKKTGHVIVVNGRSTASPSVSTPRLACREFCFP
jgi:hypothetical protein